MSFEEELISEVRARPTLWDKRIDDYKNRLKSDKEWDIIAKNLNKTKADVKNKWKNLRDVFLKEVKKIRKPRSGDGGSPDGDDVYIGKWGYFEDMSFLRDVVKPRATQSNFEDSNAGTENEPENDTQITDILDAIHNPEKAANPEVIEVLEPNQLRVSSQYATEKPCIGKAATIIANAKKRMCYEEDTTTDSSRTSDVNTIVKRKAKKPALSSFQQSMIEIEKQKIKAFTDKTNTQDDEDMLFCKSLVPFFKYLSPVQKLRLRSKIQNIVADEISMTTCSTPATSRSVSILPSPVHASYTNDLPTQTSSGNENYDIRSYYENDPLGLDEC